PLDHVEPVAVAEFLVLLELCVRHACVRPFPIPGQRLDLDVPFDAALVVLGFDIIPLVIWVVFIQVSRRSTLRFLKRQYLFHASSITLTAALGKHRIDFSICLGVVGGHVATKHRIAATGWPTLAAPFTATTLATPLAIPPLTITLLASAWCSPTCPGTFR